MTPPALPKRSRARGVAAVTALLIVAIAASTATFMLAQQSAMLNQAALVTTRAQADLHARAGLDWARGILSQDARTTGALDTLAESWAQPIAALPVERALISGNLSDEQALYNLNNLVHANGTRSEADEQIVRRLLRAVELPEDLVHALIDWIDTDDTLAGVSGAENGQYLALERPYRAANQPFTQVEELYRVRGFDAARVAKLLPHVTALPGRTSVNANTAGAEVLAAVLKLPAEEAREHVAKRKAKPFRTVQEIRERTMADPGAHADVASQFFMARILVAQDDVQLASEALIKREPGANASTAIIWRRPLY